MNLIKIFRTKSRIKFSSFLSGFILIFLLAWTAFPASAAGIEASREISSGMVYPGESFAVTVHIKVDQKVEALMLDEDLPHGWQVVQWENNGTAFQNISTFKASTQEWIWTENISAGEEKTAVYNVTVPTNSKPGNFTISGRVSAYSVSATTVEGVSEVIVLDLPPEANFSANTLVGPAPLTVQFTDLSTFNPDSWEWDFDGNENIDSNERNPVYTYENPGKYTIILKANNSTSGNYTLTKTEYITVTQTPSVSKESEKSGGSGGSSRSSGSGGGSGGSGGGGSASSPESTKNVELKEISNEQVLKGIHTCFTFKGETNEIVTVEFDPKKSFGKTTAIVEMLKNTSSIAKESAPGTVYKNANIWIGNSGFSNSENFENARINFRVSRAWVSEQGVNEKTVTLYRYNQNSWNQLPTNLSGEDKVYFYFTAETPGFSPFVISGTEKRIQSAEIFPVKTGENQTLNKEKTSNEEKQGIPASDFKKEEKKSSPGFEGSFTVAELLALYEVLKKKR
ncbi:MAG TPA: PGF-pre-PGF domain-containing protein [Methanosarcina sp.]|jgi:PGF-pre-PGF domain-containing protein